MRRFCSFMLVALTALSVSATNFRFALLTDIHLSRSNPKPMEDLQRSIDEINTLPDIDFVVISGDITESGDRKSMEQAREQFKQLRVPYYATSGNHETTWSESGCTDFDKVFGSSRFTFTFQDVCFVGFNSGPVLKMADGHVAPQDILWADAVLHSQPIGQKVICVTHYPLKDGDVDNWYEVTDMLRRHNIQCVVGGHYHRNLLHDYDGIPGFLCRSNLRGKADINGYTIISVGPDSIRTYEKVIGEEPQQWLTLPMGDMHYGAPDQSLRPDYSVNQLYPNVKEVWRCPLKVGIYSAPTRHADNVFVGDDEGNMYCVDYRSGNVKWKKNLGSRINSTPVVEDGCVVFGVTDGSVVCLSESDGRVLHKHTFTYEQRAVMGCPVVATIKGKKAVLIGGNGHFYAFDLHSFAVLWDTRIEGYCVSRPCVYDKKVYFGAWGCFFYALNIADGSVAWIWSNGSSNDKYSPAAVWPVASNGRVFIVAPDRVFTCLDAKSGNVIYRTAKHKVRENIGISDDGNTVFSRCMWDSIQAMDARTAEPVDLWCVNAEYGYDHDPSMMICKDGVIIFGTKNGLMHGVEAATGKILWRHKIGNCVVNTICPVSANECLITSSDGNLIRLTVATN